MHTNFEDRLIDKIEPIRNFVLSSSINHLFSSGIYDCLADGSKSVSDMESELSLNPEKTKGFLSYLRNENIVQVDGGQYALTSYGESFSEARPWYEMLIGGYGETFLGVADGLHKDSGALTRNIISVGKGSCGISHYDAFPLTKKLLDEDGFKPATICDLGCGNAYYLTEFCGYFDNVKTIGVEPDKENVALTNKYLAQTEYHDQIKVVESNAIDFVNNSEAGTIDLFVLGFVLHEILGQSGEAGVRSFLGAIKEKHQHAKILIIEVDNQIDNNAKMKHKLAGSYYNPYYLLHYFTDQKLETKQFWDELFDSVGYKIAAYGTTSEEVDSTGLELGYLLEVK